MFFMVFHNRERTQFCNGNMNMLPFEHLFHKIHVFHEGGTVITIHPLKQTNKQTPEGQTICDAGSGVPMILKTLKAITGLSKFH